MSYFKQSEFTCNCGCGLNNIKPELIEKLNNARAEAGVPFIITSGSRCEKQNKKVGGVKNSSHLEGYAADIALNASTRQRIIAAVLKHFNRVDVGISYVHVDVDPGKKPFRRIKKD